MSVWGGSRTGAALLLPWLLAGALWAETCTTQSQMDPATRDALAAAARSLTGQVVASASAQLRGETTPELQKDFGAVTYLVTTTAPKLKGGSPVVEQVYLLDATAAKGGGTSEAQFFCSLNRSEAEADFLIPGLVPGTYGFAVVEVAGAATPFRISYLLRQENGRWLMAGIYPTPTAMAGHDGLWYWRQAREAAGAKQSMTAWLDFSAAENLLRPAAFVDSTHLEKLAKERSAAAPPVLSEGVSAETAMVLKAKNGSEYRVTALALDDSRGFDRPDVLLHLSGTSGADEAARQAQNGGAAQALLAAFPELRQHFHGVAVVSESQGANPVVTEAAMTTIS